MDELITKLVKINDGFKPFEEEAVKIIDSHSMIDSKNIALNLLKSNFYQIRSCAVFILGFISSEDKSALHILKEHAKLDSSWQVQEIIAKAFDQFCKDSGYENSPPQIKEWLSDENPNVCRAVTEGLRIWTNRSYFREYPDEAIKLISIHKASTSEYLRKSVGNSLRDIKKKHPELIENEISKWNLDDNNIAFTYSYVKNRH